MIRHLLVSLLSALLMMIGVICMVFVILQFTPGDPVQAIVGEHSVPPALRAALEERYHLNDPMPLRLYHYFANLLHGDLGSSFGTQVPVTTLLAERAPRTIALASAGFLLAILVGATIGIAAGATRSRLAGALLNTAAIVGYSVPTFWLGQVLVILFAVKLGWLPTQGMSPMFSRASGLGIVGERLPYIVLPMVTYAIHEGARVARLIRSSVSETLNQSFITTARMKGLSEGAIVRGHVLRNSALPVVVVMGYAFGAAMGGTILIETVFSWPGVGLLLVDAIRGRDNQVVVGVVLFVAAAIVTMNLIVDFLYMWLDPRVRAR